MSEPAPLSDRMLELLGRPDGPLAGASLWALEVVDARPLTPLVRRIDLTGDGLTDLDWLPGQDLMFRLPLPTGKIGNRRYTIRTLDRARAVVTIDAVIHGHGPGARWAAETAPGDRIDAIGPRGKITVDPDATWHWFCADESGVPATLAMIEALPAGTSALALCEVRDADEHQPFLAEPAADVEMVWLHRGDVAPGHGTAIADALGARTLPDGDGRAYLAAEAKQVRAWTEQLKVAGLPADRISGKSYWVLGRESEGR